MIALHNKIEHIRSLEKHLLEAVNRCGSKAKFIVSFIKQARSWDHKLLYLTTDRLCLQEVEKHIFQNKNPTEDLANLILELLTEDRKVADECMKRLIVLWGHQRSFV